MTSIIAGLDPDRVFRAIPEITGTLQLTFTSCLGTGLETTDTPQLSLSK
jgi:hypothetical protein